MGSKRTKKVTDGRKIAASHFTSQGWTHKEVQIYLGGFADKSDYALERSIDASNRRAEKRGQSQERAMIFDALKDMGYAGILGRLASRINPKEPTR